AVAERSGSRQGGRRTESTLTAEQQHAVRPFWKHSAPHFGDAVEQRAGRIPAVDERIACGAIEARLQTGLEQRMGLWIVDQRLRRQCDRRPELQRIDREERWSERRADDDAETEIPAQNRTAARLVPR